MQKGIFIVLLTMCRFIFAQIEYLPFDFYSTNVDSNIYYAEQYLKTDALTLEPKKAIKVLGFLIQNCLMKPDYNKADSISKKSKIYLDKIPSKKIKAILIFWQGNIYRYINKMPEALNCYFEANRVFLENKDWPSLMATKIELAEFYRKIGNYKKATEYIEDAHVIKKEKNIDNQQLNIMLYNRIAAISNEINLQGKSISYSNKCIQIAKKNNNKYYEASSYNELGFTYMNLHIEDSAIYYYNKAEKMFWNIGTYEYAIHTMNNRAMLYNHYGYPKSLVIKTYKEIEDLITQYKVPYTMEKIYSKLYDEHINIGDSLTALRYFYKYHAAVVKSMSKKSQLKLIEMTEKYENEKIKSQLINTTEILNKTSTDLTNRKKENMFIYIFLFVLTILSVVIIYLLFKLNKNNKKLKKRNQEKDIFIQEIHHRVKNNLQFVSSLINMQVKASSDDKEIVSLNEASRRIRAMALVHEMLYKQDESTGVFIKQYLEELISSLNDVINSDSVNIQFKTDIINKEFSITSSIALGMIASELISNSIKYAFNNIEKPVISIELKQADEKDEFMLTVKDNGIGLKLKENDSQKLGMRLVDIFSRQLKGDYKIYNDSGCVYELTFKIQ